MAKPASGTALDGSNALVTGLVNVWAFLEGSGTTTADSKSSNTATLNTGATWTTDADGPLINAAGTIAAQMTLASVVTLVSTQSWSIAWRGKQSSAGSTAGMVVGGNTGDADSGEFVWMEGGGPSLNLRSDATEGDRDFTFGADPFTTQHDWVLVWNQGATQLHLYQDGTEVASSPLTATSARLDFSVLTGWGGGFSLTGTMSYIYVWENRALTASDASSLSSSPYQIFLSATLPFVNPYQPNPSVASVRMDLLSHAGAVRLSLLSHDQFFGGAGQAPVYDYPNPRQKPTPIDHLTFLNSTEVQLIGKDQFFGSPGMGPEYDYPNPREKPRASDLATFINATELQLLGKDTFFRGAGQAPVYDYPNPLTKARGSDLITFLKSPTPPSTILVPPPFSATDWPLAVPVRRASELLSFVGPICALAGQDALIIRLMEWPVPLRAPQPSSLWTWLNGGLATGGIPFQVGAVAYLPPVIPYASDLRTFVQATNLLFGKDQFFGSPGMGPDYDYPNPIPPKQPSDLRTFTAGLPRALVGADAMVPATQRLSDWPNPRSAPRAMDLLTWVLNLSESSLAPLPPPPFVQTDWPLAPRSAARAADLSTFVQALYTLAGADRLSGLGPGSQAHWPVPRGPAQPADVRTHLQALVTTTLLVLPVPFALLDWPVPPDKLRASDLRTYVRDLQRQLVSLDQFFAAPGQGAAYDYPNPIPRGHATDLRTFVLATILALGVLVVTPPARVVFAREALRRAGPTGETVD